MSINEEGTPLIDRKESSKSFKSSSSWSLAAKVVLVAGLSAVGTLAVLTNTNNVWRRQREEYAIKQIQLAKEGRVGYSSLSDNEKEALFKEYKEKFGRKYDTSTVEKRRFKQFLKFLNKVDERNVNERKNGGTAVHGMTIFSDMSNDEFTTKYLSGYQPVSSTMSFGKQGVLPLEPVASSFKYKSTFAGSSKTVTNVDWTGVYTTAIKDQGDCGSCWAFSVTSQVESDAIRQGYLSTNEPLSVQQLIACDSKDNGIQVGMANLGCGGGDTVSGFAYMEIYGFNRESEYPYTSFAGENGACLAMSDDYAVKVKTTYLLDNEDDMIDYVLSTGPLSVCVNADDWGR